MEKNNRSRQQTSLATGDVITRSTAKSLALPSAVMTMVTRGKRKHCLDITTKPLIHPTKKAKHAKAGNNQSPVSLPLQAPLCGVLLVKRIAQASSAGCSSWPPGIAQHHVAALFQIALDPLHQQHWQRVCYMKCHCLCFCASLQHTKHV